MKSHISVLFQLGSKLSTNEIMELVRNKIKTNGIKNSQDFIALEEYLNKVFYGTNSSIDVHKKLASAATAYLEKHLGRTFESYDFAKNAAITTNTSGKININDYSATSHSQRIEVATIRERKKQAEKQLELLALSPSPDKDFAQIKQDLIALKSACEQLLSTSDVALYGKNQIPVIKVTNQTEVLINTIDNLYQQVTFYGSLPLNVQAIGNIFEQALQAVGNGTQIENLTDEILRESFRSTSTAGSQVVSRGTLFNCNATLVIPNENKNKNNQTTSVDYEVIGDAGSYVKIKGAFTPKQGKMDVNISLPGTNEKFRVSAKNWSKINNLHDFGNTNLAHGILRTSGLNPMLAYGLRAGYDGADSKVHEYAKMCVIVDILMGYSQDTHWVDTVIINDRSSGKIKVYSVENILNKIVENLKTFNLTGFNAGTISSHISSKLNYGKQLGPQNYLNVIYSALKSYKLTLTVNPGLL